MPQIDPRRLMRNAAHIAANNGEVMTVRRFVSATQGAAAFGQANTFSYVDQIVTALMYERRYTDEEQLAGGITTRGQLFVSIPFEMGQRDYATWRGTAYMVDGAIKPENVGGRVQYRTPIAVMQRTGM